MVLPIASRSQPGFNDLALSGPAVDGQEAELARGRVEWPNHDQECCLYSCPGLSSMKFLPLSSLTCLKKSQFMQVTCF